MTNFNFEHYFEEEPGLQEETNTQITYQERPSLAFLQKQSLPQKLHINELSLSPDVKQFFKPSIEDKKEIIEDFLKWAWENNYSLDVPGTHLKYLEELKK